MNPTFNHDETDVRQGGHLVATRFLRRTRVGRSTSYIKISQNKRLTYLYGRSIVYVGNFAM